MNNETTQYGIGNISYLAAGELAGLSQLVECFYGYMEKLPEAKKILAMHNTDLSLSKKKLAFFLSGWLGGPKLYAAHFGGINIPDFHKQFPISHRERDAWLLCMQKAVADQPFEEKFKTYLLDQLQIPAERIRRANCHQ